MGGKDRSTTNCATGASVGERVLFDCDELTGWTNRSAFDAGGGTTGGVNAS